MIRTSSGDWLNFPEDCGPEVFLPYGIEASVSANSEIAQVTCRNSVYSFSMEEPGIQVVLESGNASETEANEFIHAVVITVSKITNQDCNFIRYA